MTDPNVIQWTGNTVALTPVAPRAVPIESRPLPTESHSRFLHVVEHGAVLRRAGARILVTKADKILAEVSAMKLQGVLLYGNIQVSTQCLRNLLDQGVWLSFFSRDGQYRGRIQPPAESGGKLRAQQWERSRDPDFCLRFAHAVVRGKILAQLDVAARYSKNYLAETLGESHASLRQALDRIPSVASLEELRGVEGSASRAYFALFRRCNRSAIPFERREKRGAADPINALLNFGYTLLTRELDGLIESAGLEPTAGFYHAGDEDRPSLACDWVEEFRHVVVDRLVLSLVNRGTIQAEHFEAVQDRGLRMRPDILRKFVAAYERVMIGGDPTTGDVPASGYRAIFLQQLGALLDAITGRDPYRSHLET